MKQIRKAETAQQKQNLDTTSDAKTCAKSSHAKQRKGGKRKKRKQKKRKTEKQRSGNQRKTETKEIEKQEAGEGKQKANLERRTQK